MTILHRRILQILYKIKNKNQNITALTLFERCHRELPNPAPEIERAIRDLFRKKYLVEGRSLTKDDILTNQYRNKIYRYILENNGTHKRELMRFFGLGAFLARHHLHILKIFGFIREKKYKNRLVFFPIDFEETREEEALILGDKTNRAIYDCIKSSNQVRLSEIVKTLEIPASIIQYHLKQLLKGNLINKIELEKNAYYIVGEVINQDQKGISC